MQNLNSKNIVARAVLPKLLPEEIDIVVQQFEDLFAKKVLTLYNMRHCQICKHPERIELNKRILAGTTRDQLEPQYGDLHVSWGPHLRHLSIVLRPQAVDALVDMAARIQAEIPFPLNGSRTRQLNWVHAQFMVARQIAFDHMDNPFEVSWGAFDRYVNIIGKVRDTICLVHDKGGDKDPKEKDDDQNMEDLLTADQRKLLKVARERRTLVTLAEVGKRGQIAIPKKRKRARSSLTGATIGELGKGLNDLAASGQSFSPENERGLEQPRTKPGTGAPDCDQGSGDSASPKAPTSTD